MLTLDHLEISRKKYKNGRYHSEAKENVGKTFFNKDTLESLLYKHASGAVLQSQMKKDVINGEQK